MLLKFFHAKDRSLQFKLFSVFVLSIFLHNSPIWSPHFVKDIVVIEHVQKYFRMNLKGLHDKPYKERLSILKFSTLECHCAYNDLIFLYKIIHGHSDISFQNMFTPIAFNSSLVLRRNPYQLNLPCFALIYLNTTFIIAQLKPGTPFLSYMQFPTLTPFKKLLMPYLCQAVFNEQHNV